MTSRMTLPREALQPCIDDAYASSVSALVSRGDATDAIAPGCCTRVITEESR